MRKHNTPHAGSEEGYFGAGSEEEAVLMETTLKMDRNAVRQKRHQDCLSEKEAF